MKSEFQKIADEIAWMVEKKDAAYGRSVETCAEILKIYFPDGIPPEKYLDASLMIRCFDKFSRIAHDPHAFNENPWKDITGYSIRAVAIWDAILQGRNTA